jgi:FMN reductase
MDYLEQAVTESYPEIDFQLIDLAEYEVQLSDGRHYMAYEGDTDFVINSIMEADAYIIGTPIIQASIPAALKNVFDLLPSDAFEHKVVSLYVTAGSAKHYLVAEQQLKPILTYMKAEVLHDYVFLENKAFHNNEIIDPDVSFRLNRLFKESLKAIKKQQYIMDDEEFI